MATTHRRRGAARVLPLALGALLLASCAESTPAATPGTGASGSAAGEIKIGAILDITGAGASLGVPERKALELLAEQTNAKGGIDGRQVKLLIEDNQSTEDGAAKAMAKMVNTEKVDIVLGASRTGPSLAMKPTAESAKIPMISLAANAKIVEGARYVFKTAQNDRVVIENIIELAKARGWKTIGLARDASGFGEGIAEMLDEVGKADGIKVVDTQKFAPDATDFSAQMVNLRDAKADVNLIWGIPPAAALAQKEYQRLGIKTPVLQSHGIGNKVFLDTAGAAGDGLIAPLGRLVVADQLKADDPQKAVIADFVKAYSTKYPGENPSTFAGHAADAYNLAAKAIDEVGTDKEKVRDYLEGVKGFVGISGVFNMTPEDHSGLSKDALVLVTVEGSAFKLLEGAS